MSLRNAVGGIRGIWDISMGLIHLKTPFNFRIDTKACSHYDFFSSVFEQELRSSSEGSFEALSTFDVVKQALIIENKE